MVTRRTFVAAGTSAAALLAMPAIGRAQGMKLDLSTVWPDGNFHTKNCKRFAEEVAKATGGAVEIVVHAGGSLGYKGRSTSMRCVTASCRWPISSTSSRSARRRCSASRVCRS